MAERASSQEDQPHQAVLWVFGWVTAMTRSKAMKGFIFALVSFGAFATTARAQDAIPDLKGTWSGKGKAIVFGNNLHHPGSQTVKDPPRVHEIEATYVVEGQDGRVAWRRSASAVGGQYPRTVCLGDFRRQQDESLAPIWTDISISRLSRPTAWKSVTPRTAQARADRSSPPAMRWIGQSIEIRRCAARRRIIFVQQTKGMQHDTESLR